MDIILLKINFIRSGSTSPYVQLKKRVENESNENITYILRVCAAKMKY